MNTFYHFKLRSMCEEVYRAKLSEWVKEVAFILVTFFIYAVVRHFVADWLSAPMAVAHFGVCLWFCYYMGKESQRMEHAARGLAYTYAYALDRLAADGINLAPYLNNDTTPPEESEEG